MSVTVQFKDVTKKYRLGMTRTSIPTMLSSWAKSALHRAPALDADARTHWAVRDVSFELERGNSLALVGANGAGKTTILKLLAQITRPTSGEIHVNGKLSALIELGAGFHPDLSGRENIYLNGAILGLKKEEIRRRLDSIIAFSELERFIDTPVKRYSSGMAVRLGFAIAASIDPDVLLVDEVLAVGDSSFRLKCMNRIQELLKNGTTLIFVSHNMGLVKAVCNQGLYIEKGQSKFFGSTNDVIEVYNRVLNEQRMGEREGEQAEENIHRGTAEITRLDVQGVGAGKENVLNTNQPARITVHYHAYHDIGEVAMVLRIIRSDGVFCSTMYSRQDGAPVMLRQGRGTISATLNPLQLFPGTYYVVATLKNKSESLSFDMTYSDWFHVEGDGAGYEDLDAIFEPNRIWDHQMGTSEDLSGALKSLDFRNERPT